MLCVLCCCVFFLVVATRGELLEERPVNFSAENNATSRQLRLCDEATGRCWPSLWLLGAQKSATTSVHDALTQHLKFCAAEVRGMNFGKANFFAKESHAWFEYLIPRGVEVTESRDSKKKFFEDFTDLYQHDRIKDCRFGFIEATPQLHNLMTPLALRGVVPQWIRSEARYIAILREPISRSMSWFVHAKDFEDQKRCFWPCPAKLYERYEDYATCWTSRLYDPLHANDGLWPSVYARQIDAWKHVVPRKHFLILQMDAVLDDWQAILETIARFAGVDHKFMTETLTTNVQLQVLNLRGGKTKKTISCQTRTLLNNFFDPWNDELYAMLAYDRARSRAPGLEPPFPPFKPIDCHNN